MKIEQWQVENGIAKPVNPYKQQIGNSRDFKVREEDMDLYSEFKKVIVTNTFVTNAPPGIHSAEMFGEVEWQMQNPMSDQWINTTDNEPNKEYASRQFLPFKHPVEPNDKQPMEKEYWCCADCEMSFDKSELGYKDECPICGDICEIVLIDCHVQPLNPNANAIKIIEQYKADLKAEWNESGNPFKPDYYNNKIYALNHILKLLQS